MSGTKKNYDSVILVLCIVLLAVGIVGVLIATNMAEDAVKLNMTKETLQTVALSCLNAGWIGALIVGFARRRRR